MSMTNLFKALDVFVLHAEDTSHAITSLAAAEEYLKEEEEDEDLDDEDEAEVCWRTVTAHRRLRS